MLRKKQKFVEIISFERIWLRVNGMRITCEYELLQCGENVKLSRSHMKYCEKPTLVLDAEKTLDLSDVLEVLNNCEMTKWNGFNGKHPKGVCDGDMFSLEAIVNGGIEISASGSANFPNHYHEFVCYLNKTLSE